MSIPHYTYQIPKYLLGYTRWTEYEEQVEPSSIECRNCASLNQSDKFERLNIYSETFAHYKDQTKNDVIRNRLSTHRE